MLRYESSAFALLSVLLVGDMMSCHQRDLPRAEKANAVYHRLQAINTRMEALENANKRLMARLEASIRGKHVEAKFKDMEAEAEAADAADDKDDQAAQHPVLPSKHKPRQHVSPSNTRIPI